MKRLLTNKLIMITAVAFSLSTQNSFGSIISDFLNSDYEITEKFDNQILSRPDTSMNESYPVRNDKQTTRNDFQFAGTIIHRLYPNPSFLTPYHTNFGSQQSHRMSDHPMSTNVNFGDIFTDGNVWLKHLYSRAIQSIKENVSEYSSKTHGFSVGVDSTLKQSEDKKVGIAYSYIESEIVGRDNPDQVDTKNHIFNLYSSYQEDDFFFNGRMSYSIGKNTAYQYTNNRSLNTKYDSKIFGIGMTGGYTYQSINVFTWQPNMAINYNAIKTCNYSESIRNNGQACINPDDVNNRRFNLFELGVGLQVLKEININSTAITSNFGIMGFHNFKKDPVYITGQFNEAGKNLYIHGSQVSANRFQFNTGINMEFYNDTIMNFSYVRYWFDSFKTDNFTVELRHAF